MIRRNGAKELAIEDPHHTEVELTQANCPFEHGVEGLGQVFDLVVGSVQCDAFVQAAVGDPAGGRGDLLQWMQRSPG